MVNNKELADNIAKYITNHDLVLKADATKKYALQLQQLQIERELLKGLHTSEEELLNEFEDVGTIHGTKNNRSSRKSLFTFTDSFGSSSDSSNEESNQFKTDKDEKTVDSEDSDSLTPF